MGDVETAQRVCRLITLQRGVVRMARLLDIELGHGDQHERQFSSGEFLNYLYFAISEDGSPADKRFVNAEAHIFASYKRAFTVSLRLHAFITSELSLTLNQARDRITKGKASMHPYDGHEIAARVETSAQVIRAMLASLRPVSEDAFTDQAESGIVAIQALLDCSQSMRLQIAVYDEADSTERASRRTFWQNRAMIFWAFIAVIIAIGAFFLGIATMDVDKAVAFVHKAISFIKRL